MHDWLGAHRLSQPTPVSSVVVHRHYADNGIYGMVEELMQHLPTLAGSCMAVKGLKYKSQWKVWGKHEVQLQSGDDCTFDIKKLHEGLILVGGELGPIDSSIILGDDNFVKEKLKKKAKRIVGYLRTLV